MACASATQRAWPLTEGARYPALAGPSLLTAEPLMMAQIWSPSRIASAARRSTTQPAPLEKTVPGLKEIIQRHILTPEFGTPDDIAALAAFLASDEARYITGENISISGGGLIHQPHYADLLAFMQAQD